MYPYKNDSRPRSIILQFTYPRLHTGKSWYVDFTSYDPAIGEMRRKKYMINSISKISDRRKRATELIEALTKRLRAGWSPWVNVDDNRGYTDLNDALDKYQAYINKMDKDKTRKSYSSRLTIFREFLKTRVVTPKYVYQYDTALISDFLDWIHLDRDCSPRTRNNYRGWCSSLASFFIEREYIAVNPTEKIKNLTESPKIRQPLSGRMLRQLSQYLSEKNLHYLLACRMEYYTFIRPTELSYLKISDISLKNQTVFIPGEVSKNRRDGLVGLNDEIVKLMLDLGVFNHPGDYYLFSDGMRPGKNRMSSEIFRREWKKIRKALKWSKEYQFYSLKDSGLRDLANAEGIVIARDQARHTDISTTNKYLQGRNTPIHSETIHFNGVL
ncbi:MAG: tyrosine-type recombinase/integrase [Muribaculaceae bacterium]|nr:tyrosine-type recombinase/integrase [Muribaculaceae bacterium]MBO5187434.1 tyrosine-type recombinase/integrase [Prevotella sp.]